jgi:hypothetical protein
MNDSISPRPPYPAGRLASAAVALFLAANAGALAAPGFFVPSGVLAGGGGPGSGGSYTVAATVGDTAGAPAVGGPYGLAAGFVPAAVAHSATLPDLVVGRTEAGIRLTWKSPDAAVHLQRSASLQGAPWIDTPAGVDNDGKTHAVQLGTAAAEQFFRLSR